LDSLNWDSNWIPSPDFENRVRKKLVENQEWIVDGNNEKVRDFVWINATVIIWLDYPLYVIFWRLVKRTFKRLLFREILWNGNIERWSVVFSWNSIILWCITMFFRYKKEFPEWILKYPHLNVLRFKSNEDSQQWLHSLQTYSIQ